MKVQSINNNPTFGTLKITPKGEQTLKKVYNENHWKYIEKAKSDLANTKLFDLEIDSVGCEPVYNLLHKTESRWSSEGPLYPYSIEDNKVVVFGRDLIDSADFAPYHLKFPSSNEAAEAYRDLTWSKDNNGTPLQPFNWGTFLWAVNSVKLLDKYFCKY